MKRIGRVLACALLAAALAKNALATSAANIEFPKGRCNETGRSVIARFDGLPLVPSPDVRVARSISNDVLEGANDERDVGHGQSRTFGLKRLQFMLMPMMYKMGVMMTMLMVLMAISAKGLFIGIILLILKLGTFLSKFHSGWHHESSHPWSPPQPIHVHVHNSPAYAHSHAYHGWEPPSSPGSEDHYYYKG